MPLSRYDTEGGCKGTKNREKCKGKLIFLCFSWCFPSVPVPSPRSVLSSRIPSAPRPRPSCPFLADFIRASSASVPSFSRGFYPCLVCVRPVLFSRILSVPRLCPSRPFLADFIRASPVSVPSFSRGFYPRLICVTAQPAIAPFRSAPRTGTAAIPQESGGNQSA